MGASLIVMAIIGGAVLTVCMGAMSDGFGITVAYLVPAACYAVVLAFALGTRKAATPVGV